MRLKRRGILPLNIDYAPEFFGNLLSFKLFGCGPDSNSRRPLERCLLLVFSSPAMSN
jgi:hypothetical protein